MSVTGPGMGGTFSTETWMRYSSQLVVVVRSFPQWSHFIEKSRIKIGSSDWIGSDDRLTPVHVFLRESSTLRHPWRRDVQGKEMPGATEELTPGESSGCLGPSNLNMRTKSKTESSVKRNFDTVASEVLSEFNFVAVHRMMRAANWKWGGEVPLPEQIRYTAAMLLENLKDGKIVCSMTGGLEASWEDVEGERRLRLRFIFEEADGTYCKLFDNLDN